MKISNSNGAGIPLFLTGILLGLLGSCCSVDRSVDSCACSPSEATETIAEWEKVRHGLSSQGHRYMFQSLAEEMAKQDDDLGKEFAKILKSHSASRMVVKVELYLSLLRRPEILQSQLLHDIRRSPEWAKRALTLIPQSGGALNKVLSKVVDVSNLSWRRCVNRLGRMVIETVVSATLEARCRILNGTGEPTHGIEGEVTFSQKLTGGLTTVHLDVRGFNSPEGTEHAFHIHKVGQTSNRCVDAGPHFNPHNKDHGAPADQERHIGDLGNVVVNSRGQVRTVIRDRLLELSGENSIIGRSVVIHAGVDDLGLGGFPDSKTTGHAGGRIGCCVIESV